MKLIRTINLTILATLLAWTVPATSWASPISAASYSFYSHYPWLFVLEDGDEMPQLNDEEFFNKAANVVFPVGKSELPQGTPLLNELATKVIPHLNADSLQLVRLVFRGAASPEGSVALNKQLGEQRVRAMFDFVTSKLAFPAAVQLSSIDTSIEDYHSLLIMMRRADDPDYAVVKDLCDRFEQQDLPLLKQKLKEVRQGQLWSRLLATYFPSLRTARFVMFFRKVQPDIPVTPIEPVVPVQEVAPIEPEDITPVTPAVTPAMPTIEPRRELLSVKTNLLLDAAYMPGYDRWCPIPNIAVEYYPLHGHFTFGASFDMPWWQHYNKHKFFQLRNYQVEARYYLRSGDILQNKPGDGAAFRGLYLQGYAHVGLFGICFDANRGWVGEGAGAGIGAGYVVPLSKKGHWRLELAVQAGFFRCKYDPYQYENPVNPAYHDDLYYYKWSDKPELFSKRQYRWNWIGPTRVGITVSYDLLYRPNHKNGLSFKSTERRDRP